MTKISEIYSLKMKEAKLRSRFGFNVFFFNLRELEMKLTFLLLTLHNYGTQKPKPFFILALVLSLTMETKLILRRVKRESPTNRNCWAFKFQ